MGFFVFHGWQVCNGYLQNRESFAEHGNESAHSTGLADSYLYLRYCLFDEKGWRPQIVSMFQAKMPTGKYEDANPNKLGTDWIQTLFGYQRTLMGTNTDANDAGVFTVVIPF